MRERSGSFALRALSDVFFGLALGLVAYFLLSDVFGAVQQQRLRDFVPRLATISVPSVEQTGTPGPVMDFTGWAQQDRAYWKTLREGGVFGRLIIPRMKLDTLVVKGTARADLKKGPGWIAWTSLPGPAGTCGIAGHRTTYLAPFRNIQKLRAGDTITLYSPFRRYRYRVEKHVQVTPDRGDVLADVGYPRLGLSACHPPYSARYRYVVLARLVEVRLLAETSGTTGR